MFGYLEAALSLEIRNGVMEIVASDPWVEWIEAHFPIGSNRIAWEQVSQKRRVAVLVEPRQVTPEELGAMLGRHEEEVAAWMSEASVAPGDEAMWIGDTSEWSLAMSAAVAVKRFPVLMRFPQHSYLVFPRIGGCLNYVMEGELFFAAASAETVRSASIAARRAGRGRRA